MALEVVGHSGKNVQFSLGKIGHEFLLLGFISSNENS